LLSTVWVNLIQLTVKLAGFAIVTPLALAAAGGWEALSADPARLDPFAGATPGSGWRLLFFTAPAFIVSPGLLQKAYGARDAKAVTMGVALNAGALLLFAAVPVVIGMSARVMYPSIERDLAFATVADRALSPAFGALALAAVFSAELSAADAVLFMLATSASRDLYRGYVRPDASDRSVLLVARIAAVVGAIAGVALAMKHQTVIDALLVFYSILVVTLFVPIVGGLYTQKTRRRAGLASLIGIPVLAAVHFATNGAGYGALTPVVCGVLASAAGFAMATNPPGPSSYPGERNNNP
jgi:SSS family solute:Na+ symporter